MRGIGVARDVFAPGVGLLEVLVAVADVLVLGAGIVGVSTALHLQARGRKVLLVDKAAPGRGTSFGNAGLIERASVVPYAFPRSASQLLSYLGNTHSALRFEWRALLGLAPWLWRYWRESAPVPLAKAAADLLPLIERSVLEHEPLVKAAGVGALVRQNGWIEVYRDGASFRGAAAEARSLSLSHGLRAEVLDAFALRAREPGFLADGGLVGGVHWLDPWNVSSPGALVAGYARLFSERGGEVLEDEVLRIAPVAEQSQAEVGQKAVRFDADQSLQRAEMADVSAVAALARAHRERGAGWRVWLRGRGEIRATEVVVALGPDAMMVLAPLGYQLPLVHKRGYHLHFRPRQVVPQVPLVESQAGFVLSSMEDGVRLTTGVSLTRPDALPNDGQLRAAERIARSFWPLGDAVEAEPWMGRRPCMPDMRPVIGPAPRHAGLWFNFGHAHHGLTLGPVTGRLLAELMTGETPLMNPAPFSAARFLGV